MVVKHSFILIIASSAKKKTPSIVEAISGVLMLSLKIIASTMIEISCYKYIKLYLIP